MGSVSIEAEEASDISEFFVFSGSRSLEVEGATARIVGRVIRLLLGLPRAVSSCTGSKRLSLSS